jgi:hypothetical protein
MTFQRCRSHSLKKERSSNRAEAIRCHGGHQKHADLASAKPAATFQPLKWSCFLKTWVYQRCNGLVCKIQGHINVATAMYFRNIAISLLQ